MEEQQVSLRTEGGVAILTLDRPEVRNALTPDMLDSMGDALDQCRDSDVRAVVVRGAGGAFCPGADVRDFARALEDGPQVLSSFVQGLASQLHEQVVLKIRRLPKPVIACINGVAAGGGASLALACDLRIASEDARFFLAYANIGATADGGSTYYLPRLVGPALAMEVYLMKQPISAQRAMELGLVNRVLPSEELDKHTMELAHQLASGPTVAYGRVKALIDRAWDVDLESRLAEEARTLGETALTADFQEGITAFVEKRAPQFLGT